MNTVLSLKNNEYCCDDLFNETEIASAIMLNQSLIIVAVFDPRTGELKEAFTGGFTREAMENHRIPRLLDAMGPAPSGQINK